MGGIRQTNSFVEIISSLKLESVLIYQELVVEAVFICCRYQGFWKPDSRGFGQDKDEWEFAEEELWSEHDLQFIQEFRLF